MTTIAGASQFINAATLANLRGTAAQAPTLLGDVGTGGLLELGKRLAVKGIGISSAARQLNQSFLNRTSEFNALLSLAAGEGTTIEGQQAQILALRSKQPGSALGQNFFEDV